MTEPARIRSLDWRLVAVSILVVTAATQPIFITASTIAQAGPALGYDAQGLGLLTSLFFLTAGISSTLVGGFVERVGWRPVMRINAVGSAVILVVIATVARNVTTLAVALVFAAALYGMANPAANLALARAIPPERRGLIFGLKHAGIPGSSLLAGLAVPLVTLTLGWEWTFGLAAAVGIVVLVLVPGDAGETPAVSGPPPPAMSTRWLSILGIGTAFATLAAVALGTFHVDAALAFGFSEAAAGVILAAGSLVSITARALYGFIADRYDSTGFAFVAGLTLAGAAAFVALAVAGTAGFVALTLVAFATGWAWPGLVTYSVVRANEGRPAGSTAITQAGIFMGAGFGPAGVGWLIETTSYPTAWVVVAAALVVSSAVVLVVRRQLELGIALA